EGLTRPPSKGRIGVRALLWSAALQAAACFRRPCCEAMLAQRGLRFGQSIDTQQSVTQKAVYDEVQAQTKQDDDTFDRSVNELQLSVRARKALALLNIHSIGDLCTKTEAELMGVKNFGLTSLHEIKERMSDFGLSLRTLEA
ncbi:MAG: DNA-directed RNA polymerase subunit alpha C-terminal domain-containing protein, partial [Phycisphaeraceae bacterium]|nr:DNA-directed RNA polymerase subunit alpha C-terminal domain-containing protein [Phycisphaeraceae bacterium]